MPKLGRRSFLEMGVLATGGLALPACIRDALQIPANDCTKSIRDVEHVVILIQENRSFDHYFGTMRGIRGFGDRFTLPIADGPSVFHEYQGTDVVLPYHLDENAGNAQRVEGTPHSFFDGQYAYDHGRYGRWPTYKSPRSMGYYTRAELPFQFALAEAFTLCDAYFCGIHSSTNPNRLYAFTGTNDPLGENGGPVIGNSHDALGAPEDGYTWTTYAERLEAAGVSWKVYQDMADNFSDNPLVGFRAFRQAHRSDPASPLVTKGLSTTLTNANLDGLRDDVLGGTLPSVSWIVGPADYSEHPGPSSPVQGAYYVQQVLEALTASPEVWSKTVLLVTFDENDGFFDHLPPPCPPSRSPDGDIVGDSTVDDSADRYDLESSPVPGAPFGPGVRVPMWIVSPWTRGGWVCSETFDHTSILRFLEHRFGVEEPNVSPYRRAMCGDLCSAFDFESPNDGLVPTLPTRTREQADALRNAQEQLPPVPVPTGAAAALPVQEPGTRPSRALPYELHVRERVVASRGALELVFDNRGRAGAVFHVYDRNRLLDIPRRYAVGAGKTLRGSFAPTDGAYALFVLGPNGFHREIAARSDTRLEVDTRYDAAGERLRIVCRNDAGEPATFVITPRAYRTETLTLVVGSRSASGVWIDVSDSGRWYDYEVTATGVTGFSRRLAGRIENGAPSVSDPAFGEA